MLWLSRYFRYSIQAIRVESTRTGSDRSINSSFTLVVNKVFLVKEEKEKKRKQEVMEGEGDEIVNARNSIGGFEIGEGKARK